jgi:hypothetical protein
MTTYSERPLQPGWKAECHDCGREADVELVADSPEAGTGYVDSLALCSPCFDARQGVPVVVPVWYGRS